MRRTIFSSVISAAAVFSFMGCGGGAANNSVSNNANHTVTNGNSNTAVVVNNNSTNVNSTNMNANNNVSGNVSSDFMMKAAQGGMAEVEVGKLAASKGANADVKQFGQKMVTDHSKANDELKALAAKKNFTLPADVNAEQKAMADKLSKLSGAEFDKEYVDGMVKDHEKDVADFQKEADSGTDADVKAFAAKTLPTLKSHLEMIKSIQSKMK